MEVNRENKSNDENKIGSQFANLGSIPYPPACPEGPTILYLIARR